jgi:hypothetical protein
MLGSTKKTKEKNNLQYCQSSNLLAIADPNERLVDLLRLVISMKQKQNNKIILLK